MEQFKAPHGADQFGRKGWSVQEAGGLSPEEWAGDEVPRGVTGGSLLDASAALGVGEGSRRDFAFLAGATRGGGGEREDRGNTRDGASKTATSPRSLEDVDPQPRPNPAGSFETTDLPTLLLKHRLIPTVRLSSLRHAVPLAEALRSAGLPLLQIELATPVALAAISTIRAALGDFTVGAGAMQAPGQVREALGAGAMFGAGLAMHPEVLDAARTAELPFLPAAMTPSEIAVGMRAGFLVQYVYPAAALGTKMLDALAKPYRGTRLRLVPRGGLRISDFQEFISIPQMGAVAGGFLCEWALIAAGMWEDIEAQALLCRMKAQAVVSHIPDAS